MKLEEFIEHPALDMVTPTPGGYMARCPAHQDRTPSLSISDGEDRILIKCWGPCEWTEVLEAMGLEARDLFYSNSGHQVSSEPVASYVYTDEEGAPLYRVNRHLRLNMQGEVVGKTFRQQRYENGVWIDGMAGVRRVLYRLPDVIHGVGSGQTIYIVEGEKDVEGLNPRHIATCNVGGAGPGKWLATYVRFFLGANVVVVADNDEPNKKGVHVGWEHAVFVASSLRGIVKTGWLARPPEHKDVSDHLAAGKTLEELTFVKEIK